MSATTERLDPTSPEHVRASLALRAIVGAESVQMIRPIMAALELSQSKIATWASVGFAVAVLAGWDV